MSQENSPPAKDMPPESLLRQAMTLTGKAQDAKFLEAAQALQLDMEGLASKLKDLVLSQPPDALLGYLWAELLMSSTLRESAPSETPNLGSEGQRELLLFALEYVHAILSCFDLQLEDPGQLQEGVTKEIVATAERLRNAALYYCMASSHPRHGAEFGDETGHVEYLAKTTWVLIRGNRYQVLEEEFFQFVLEPHDDAVHRAYGIGADEVAAGIQAISSAMREGFARAAEKIHEGRELTHRLADEHEISLEEAMGKLKKESPETITTLEGAFKDVFFGGLCNLSRQTRLPDAFLEDLSFDRGENKEFFEPGPFCGTPLRTLPSRIKPLVRLSDGFYATEPMFVRDAAYRAIQRGVVTRISEYREKWNRRQKALTEAAFPRIFEGQLEGASVLTEVYYLDVASGQWVENDTLILLDDVLIQVEVRAGLGAMHSPATNFSSHVRTIQSLVIKAYRQIKRFFDYLDSESEVALYQLRDGEYVEVRRLRISDFRLLVPIGLTVESFTPFSSMCKELPEVEPLLGKYPFVSMSIDDLFVLNRLLPTTGELLHYLEVRQQVAGIRGANLFDELDHLGAYIVKNRFDLTLREQLDSGADMVTWDAFSAEIDQYFAGERWLREAPPTQAYPDELKQIFKALSKERAPGWLKVDALLRNLGSEARVELAGVLKNLLLSLKNYDQRWFIFSTDPPLLVWLSRDRVRSNIEAMVHQAEVAALATKSVEVQALHLSVTISGDFTEAQGVSVPAPSPMRVDYQELMSKAKSLRARIMSS